MFGGGDFHLSDLYFLSQFVEFSGGLEGGSDPPSFQRAELERLAKLSAEEKEGEPISVSMPYPSIIEYY